MIATRLTEALQIDHPVMLAGMGGVSYHRLATAVSEAGGFGCLGASTMADDEMRTEIAAVAEATDKPFGVDLLTALPRGLEDKVRDIIDGGATAFVAGLGVPREVVDLCHERGLVVVNMCGKVRHAIAAVEAGCDIVVAQGTEAGGHTGQVATMALVPQIVDAVGDLIGIVGRLKRHGVGFQSLHEKLDTTTAGGMFFFHVFAALAEVTHPLRQDLYDTDADLRVPAQEIQTIPTLQQQEVHRLKRGDRRRTRRAIQQRDLAEHLARPHDGQDDVTPFAALRHHFEMALLDQVKIATRVPLADDLALGGIAHLPHASRQL